ncbi:DUF2927 domain-containing protein [Salimicrobium halophilum]|uniref:SbsA Ig-like domain-containing protein n=1 Tax=Salimicrobium halophilum TaxID=86666 RepID=A0A1G8SDN4_9BACI|nr:DUF2927 domain-containing protein [Salimicrobium halophilum]SDJ27369.1 Protein of unknown function [Salimicrobium halophilum]
MKQMRIIASGLLVLLLGLLGNGVVSADSPWDQTDVDPHHDWTVDFSTKIQVGSASNESIYVRDSVGNRYRLEVQLTDDRESVVIKAPQEGYQPGVTYELVITDEVKSAEGTPMEEAVTMVFTVGDSPEYPEYSAKEIDYFTEIAIGSEWQDGDIPIRKWEDDPRIKVYGNPTSQDQAEVEEVIGDVNNLQDQIDLQLVEEDPSIEVYYAPISEFDKYVTNPKPGNWGLFYYWMKNGYTIYKSKILIATDVTNQAERSHLLREELTQTLGLPRDSKKYADSMFYQDWTTTQEFSDLDQALVRMLYDDRIHVGMTRDEVVDILSE